MYYQNTGCTYNQSKGIVDNPKNIVFHLIQSSYIHNKGYAYNLYKDFSKQYKCITDNWKFIFQTSICKTDY